MQIVTMNVTTAMCLVLMILLSCTLHVQSQNREVIKFNAANASVLRDEKTGVQIVNFVKLPNKYIGAVAPFKVIQVKTNKDCLLKCVATRKCSSTNFAKLPNSNGQYDCLLFATNLFKDFKQLVKDNGKYHFFTIKTKCLEVPCQNNGVCLPLYPNNSYNCSCSKCFFGDHCEKVKNKTQPFGMEDGRILDSQIQASSYLRTGLEPWRGRLVIGKGWAPLNKVAGEYLQIDVGDRKRIAAVATQGRPPGDSYNQFIKTYTLRFSDDGVQWVDYTDVNGPTKVFQGNVDRNSVVTNILPTPITARYIRIVIQTWSSSHPVLRVEVYSCYTS